jgi:hypothetical protein
MANLRKATISLVMSVCLPVRPSLSMENPVPGGRIFMKFLIWYLNILLTHVEKIQDLLKSDTTTGTLYEHYVHL